MIERFAAWLNAPRWPWRHALLAVLAASPALTCGLAIDDYAQQAVLRGVPAFGGQFKPSLDIFNFASGDVERMQQVMDIGLWPWWALPQLKTAFWRPATALTHWLDYRLWPNLPWLMHLHSLCWFGGAVFLAALWYRRVLGAVGAASLAALFYALSETHAIPAGWVANRNAEVALFWGIATLLLHDQWRRKGQLAAGGAATITFAAALLSNEGALSTTAYLFSYALLLDTGALWRRMARLTPYAIVVLLWRIVYQWGGYGAWGSPAYIDPVVTPLRYLDVAIFRAPILFASLWLTPPAEIVSSFPRQVQRLVFFWALLVLAGMLLAVWPLRKRSEARFFGVGMVLSLAPACAMVPANRLLLFSALGAMGLIAMFVEGVWHGALWRGKHVARCLAAVFILIHVFVAPLSTAVGVPVFHWIAKDIERTALRTNLDSEISGKTVVVTNAPNMFYVSYFLLLREIAGRPVPDRIRSLAPSSLYPAPLEVTRTSESTLVVRAVQGYATWLMRDPEHAFKVGDIVALEGMRVEVLEMTERGYPGVVSFTFDVPLEDPSLLWVELRDGSYEAISPPPIGATAHWRLAMPLEWRAPWLWHQINKFTGAAGGGDKIRTYTQ